MTINWISNWHLARVFSKSGRAGRGERPAHAVNSGWGNWPAPPQRDRQTRVLPMGQFLRPVRWIVAQVLSLPLRASSYSIVMATRFSNASLKSEATRLLNRMSWLKPNPEPPT